MHKISLTILGNIRKVTTTIHFKSCHGNFDDSRWLPHRCLFSG